MNKLTKLLSVFIIAGAVGTGVAGVAGCTPKPSKPSGVTHSDSHQLNYEDKGAKHEITCDVPGCDYVAKTVDHDYDDDNDTTCNNCTHTREIGGEEDDQYDLITTSVDFKAAANELAGETTSANQTVGTGGYTYGGKFFFADGNRFEPGSSCVNTQKKDVTITLGGETNSIKIVGKGASGTAGDIVLKNSSGTAIDTATSTGNGVAIALNGENLPAGVYTITSGTSVRLTEITITEKLEKSEATGITVTATKVDFLVKEDFSANGLTVILNYANGRKDTLSASDYEVTQSVDKNTAGKYTVTVKYKENESFTDTYDVYYYTIDSIEQSTIGIESNKQVTLQQAVVTGGTLSSQYLTVKGTGTVEGRTHSFNLPATALDIQLPAVTAEGEATVNYSVDTSCTTGGKALSGSYKVMVKNAISAVDNKVEITVGETGDFKTLTQAVQFLKLCELDASVNKVIKVQASATKYIEKVWIDLDNVTLMGTGEKADDTQISYSLVEGDADLYSGSLWALNCATVHVTGKNFKAYNITIRNDFDYINNADKYSGNQAAQGVALTLEGDGNVIYKCHLYGNQDTLYMKGGRTYYYKTQIDGNVDFIFGSSKGLAFFEECDIVAISRGKAENGHVAVPQHDDATQPDYGYIFYNCTLTDDGDVDDGGMTLGRPWGKKATVAYINCSFTDAYAQKFVDMSGNTPGDAEFWVYGSTDASGNAITGAPVGGKLLTAEQAANYTKENIFGTENGKAEYTTAFDWSAAYTNLRILAGLEEGEVTEDPTVEIDFYITPFPTETVQKVFEGKLLITEGTASWNDKTTYTDAIQLSAGTIIKVLTPGRISITWYGGDYGKDADGRVTYDEDGCATITLLNGGKYIKKIVVDKTDVPEATVSRTVTVYVGTGDDAVALTPFEVDDGSSITEEQIAACLKGTAYEGQVISAVYASDKTTEYAYGAINENTSIYITLSAYVLKESVDGAKYDFAVDKSNSNQYFELTNCRENSPYLKLVAGSSVKLKVAAGATVTITGIYHGWDGIKINGTNQAKESSEYTVTYTATEAGEVIIELQDATEETASPSQAALKTITVTYPEA